MAQSKSFFGLRKGSTKSLTFQVLDGKQITKDRVYNVKNPQTLAQMQQRALMATAVTAYSQMKEICDHSFEGIQVGAKTMAAFIKENIQLLSAKVPEINVTEYKSGTFVVNKYMISKGTLPAPKFEWDTEHKLYSLQLNLPKTAGGNTWGELANALGIKKDGMLTFVIVTNGSFDWIRIKFNDAMWNTKIVADDSNIESLKTSNAVEGNNLIFSDILVFGSATEDHDHIYEINLTVQDDEGGGVIVSEKSEGTWKRSTSYLDGGIKYFYDAAFSTYPVNTSLLLNGGKMPSNVIKK